MESNSLWRKASWNLFFLPQALYLHWNFLRIFFVYIFLSHSHRAHTMSPLVSCPPNPLISEPTAAMFSFSTVVNYHIYPGLSNQKVKLSRVRNRSQEVEPSRSDPALSPEFSVGNFRGSTNSANAGYVCISGYFIVANFITALMSSVLKSSFPHKPFIFVALFELSSQLTDSCLITVSSHSWERANSLVSFLKKAVISSWVPHPHDII